MPRLALALLLALPPAALAQGPKDRVYYRDRAADKLVEAEGDAVESPAGVRFTGPDRKERVIPAFDLVRIDYGALDPTVRGATVPQEADPDPAKPLAYYAAKLKDLPANANEKTRRFLQFREAYWAGRVADAKPAADEFKAEGRKAAEKMTAFVKANKKTWEQWPLARTAARLLAETGDWPAADAVLKEVGGVAEGTAELKAEAALLRVGYLIRAGRPAEAKEVLAGAAGGATGAAAERAAIYQEALAALPAKSPDGKTKPPAAGRVEALIAKSGDPAVRATGYGVLGEVYLAHQRPRDAQWSFLTVDTVYPQQPEERVWAVRRLIDLFDAAADAARADQFRDRLPKVR
jgi:hypothetical protein